MNRAYAACIFLIAAVALLWKPVFLDQAMLPGQYLQSMLPWSTLEQSQPDNQQWNPLAWDALAQFYPWRVFLGRSIAEGKLPLWNQHQFCGTPFLANGQSAVLYFPNWLFAFMLPLNAFTLLAILHLAAAGFFTYLLARELSISEQGAVVAGLCFELCAFMVLWIELPTLVQSSVWLPCALWALHRGIARGSYGWAVVAGLALTMSIFAGHLQIAMYVWLTAAAWSIFLCIKQRKSGVAVRIWAVGLAFGLSALMSLAQVLPSLELSRLSHRQVAATWENYQHFVGSGLPVQRLITAVMPDYLGNPTRSNYWLLGNVSGKFNMPADYMEYGMYCGVLGLCLALIALAWIRRSSYIQWWTAAAGVALLLAVGTYLNVPMYFGIPGLAALGGPHRVLLVYLFAVAMLAGHGVDTFYAFLDRTYRLLGVTLSARSLVALAVLVVVAAVAALGMTLADTQLAGLPQKQQDFANVVQLNALIRLVPIFLLCAVLLLVAGEGKVRKPLFGYLAALLVIADLAIWGSSAIPVSDKSKIYPETALTQQLRSYDASRVLPINRSWSLTETPEAVLPPNAAMVYGYYDVQGYDSLFTEAYKEYLTKLMDKNPCPPENGNMILGRAPAGDLGIPIEGLALRADTSSQGWIARSGWANLRIDQSEPNRIALHGKFSDSETEIRVLNYPGWRSVDSNVELSSKGIWMLINPTTSPDIRLVYEPASFKVGLFCLLIGLGTCSGILVHRRLTRAQEPLINCT